MYEPRHHRPVPLRSFLHRMAAHGGASAALMLASLAVGMAGYAGFEGLGWQDTFLNAAMILGGMGPVETLHTPAGKIFAGLYALYSGLIVLVAAGVLFAPVLHRVLHKFHWDADQQDPS
jgi:hypothetical protein